MTRLTPEREAEIRDTAEHAVLEGLRRSELFDLLAEIDALREERKQVTEFMDSVRDKARNRNPTGATLLDFMAIWNEQYEERIKTLTAENQRLEERVESLESNAIERGFRD